MHSISHTLHLNALGDFEIWQLSPPSLPTVTEDSKRSFYLTAYWEVEYLVWKHQFYCANPETAWHQGIDVSRLCVLLPDSVAPEESAHVLLSPFPHLWNRIHTAFPLMTGKWWGCYTGRSIVDFRFLIISFEASGGSGVLEKNSCTTKEKLHGLLEGQDGNVVRKKGLWGPLVWAHLPASPCSP